MAGASRFRWRVAVFTLTLAYGVLAMLAGLTKWGAMAYAYWQLGAVEPHPSTPNFNRVAMTPDNFREGARYVTAGTVALGIAIWAWMSMRRERRPPVQEPVDE